jgi:hypothetical protein
LVAGGAGLWSRPSTAGASTCPQKGVERRERQDGRNLRLLLLLGTVRCSTDSLGAGGLLGERERERGTGGRGAGLWKPEVWAGDRALAANLRRFGFGFGWRRARVSRGRGSGRALAARV